MRVKSRGGSFCPTSCPKPASKFKKSLTTGAICFVIGCVLAAILHEIINIKKTYLKPHVEKEK